MALNSTNYTDPGIKSTSYTSPSTVSTNYNPGFVSKNNKIMDDSVAIMDDSVITMDDTASSVATINSTPYTNVF